MLTKILVIHCRDQKIGLSPKNWSSIVATKKLVFRQKIGHPLSRPKNWSFIRQFFGRH